MEVRQILDGVKSLEMVIPEFQRDKPVFIEKDGKQEFFVRGSASSQRYKMSEAFEYINKHWNQ